MPDNKKNIGIYSVLALFLFLGLCYSYYTPLWTPPDEDRHFVYCEHIARNLTLPDFTPHSKNNIVGMGYQPPLYYFLGSLFCRNENKLFVNKYLINFKIFTFFQTQLFDILLFFDELQELSDFDFVFK